MVYVVIIINKRMAVCIKTHEEVIQTNKKSIEPCSDDGDCCSGKCHAGFCVGSP